MPSSSGVCFMSDQGGGGSRQDQHVPDETITALHCHHGLRLTKAYSLVGGKIVEDGYSRAKHFQFTPHKIHNLSGLYELVKYYTHTQHTCLIRGVPVSGLVGPERRLGTNFPMPDDGTRWVCLDFDGVELPPGVDPFGPEGVEHAVNLLPTEFQAASYIAQFSASAGVLNPDGTPYKPGLRAHVFFWLDRRVRNEELKGWLFDYPVDKALFTPVQPHYTADPILGPGVHCAVKMRLYLRKKGTDIVHVPDLSEYRINVDSRGSTNTEWEDPDGGLPTLDDLLTCEFIAWYLSTPHPDGERYEPTRAFAHNLRRVDTDDWEALLHSLTPPDFPYMDAIVASATGSRPISCDHIYRSVYRCPSYNPGTCTCRVNKRAMTPYGLALWMKRGLDQ